jgi:putative transposase
MVIPDLPHHVIQRGTRRMTVFFQKADYDLYRELLLDGLRRTGVQLWAYCLMPNHVHLIVAPPDEGALAALFRRVHHLYAMRINRRGAWSGHLWQARFSSAPMGERYLRRAAAYVLLNPVRAGLVREAQDWEPSSAAVHLGLRSDPLVSLAPLDRRVADWRQFLAPADLGDLEDIRRHTRTGRFLG